MFDHHECSLKLEFKMSIHDYAGALLPFYIYELSYLLSFDDYSR